MNSRSINAVLMLVVASISLVVMSADVPAILPKPDAQPPTDGKVKVYVLAGQSNMVGFGRYSGAAPVYPTIYLSADPAVVPCRMPVGASALLPHGVYQSADKDAPKGAIAKVYPGMYDIKADYSKVKPAKEEPVALGTVDAKLPSIDGEHTVIVNAFIDVPSSGAYEMHVGYEDSTYSVAMMDNKVVYSKDKDGNVAIEKVTLERGKRYPLTIIYSKGGSAALWLEHVDLKGKGDLATLNKDGKYLWFVDNDGKSTKRTDVTYWDVRTSKEPGGSGGLLHTRSNGKHIGPEVPFGYVMGTYHEEPVLLIESSMGNRALNFDFLPPSSPRSDEDKANKYCGFEYNAMVTGVRETLKNIDKVVPNYKGQGYEVVGFAWFQGHKDGGSPKEVYEGHLVNLINDLRKDLNAPDMRAVVATVGFGGMKLDKGYDGIHAAQMAVGDPEQHPEFAGKVASVDTRPFWRTRADSPTGTGYHYNHNAETYILTGDSLGRAMVGLLGGKADKLDVPPPEKRHPDVDHIYSNEIVVTYSPRSQQKYDKRSENPTDEGYANMASALKPIIGAKMIPAFIEGTLGETRVRAPGLPLEAIVKGVKPKKMSMDISSQLDTLIGYYETIGITDYSWKPFGPEMKSAKWNYYSFDPAEKQPFEKSNRLRKITFPQGMENWISPDFDAAKAGWKAGPAPFGQMDGKQEGRKKTPCYAAFCECHTKPATLWEKEVLLMQQTFELPAAKKGHVYRVLLGGANCDRSGEAFAVYINGKLLTESKGGFFRNGGIRGAYLFADTLPELKGGKVTIAVLNHLRYTHFGNGTVYFGTHPDYKGKPVPPNGQVSLWIEEAKLPADVLEAAPQK